MRESLTRLVFCGVLGLGISGCDIDIENLCHPSDIECADLDFDGDGVANAVDDFPADPTCHVQDIENCAECGVGCGAAGEISVDGVCWMSAVTHPDYTCVPEDMADALPAWVTNSESRCGTWTEDCEPSSAFRSRWPTKESCVAFCEDLDPCAAVVFSTCTETIASCDGIGTCLAVIPFPPQDACVASCTPARMACSLVGAVYEEGSLLIIRT